MSRIYFKILITTGNFANNDSKASVLTLNCYSSLFCCSFLFFFVGLNDFYQYLLRIIAKIFNTNQRFWFKNSCCFSTKIMEIKKHFSQSSWLQYWVHWFLFSENVASETYKFKLIQNMQYRKSIKTKIFWQIYWLLYISLITWFHSVLNF